MLLGVMTQASACKGSPDLLLLKQQSANPQSSTEIGLELTYDATCPSFP